MVNGVTTDYHVTAIGQPDWAHLCGMPIYQVRFWKCQVCRARGRWPLPVPFDPLNRRVWSYRLCRRHLQQLKTALLARGRSDTPMGPKFRYDE